MLNIEKGQRVVVWEVEDKDNYALVKMGSSRKDKRDDSYKNSNWSFVRFVGKAYEKLQEQDDWDGEGWKKVRIELHGAGISLEPYENKDGEKAWPKNAQIVVFNFEMPEVSGNPDEPPASKKPAAKKPTKKPASKPASDYDEDEFPF